MQLLFFILLKITIGNKFCFFNSLQNSCFPLKISFSRRLRVDVLTVHKNTGCFAVPFNTNYAEQSLYVIILKTLCMLQTLLLNSHFRS